VKAAELSDACLAEAPFGSIVALTVVSSWPSQSESMNTTPPLIRRLGLLVACLFVAATTACSASSGPATAPSTAPSTAGPSAPSPLARGSSAPSTSSSAPAVKSESPVPVESNPPGDIPDNLAFVRYTDQKGAYTFTHPEGWARTGSGTRVRFTDKLNGVSVESTAATQAPTVASAKTHDEARLRASVPAFELRKLSPVTLPGGRGVHIVFRRNSAPDAVTGRVFRDEVEEYAVFSNGRLVRMDLYGPVGADNVDAYRTMSQSLRIR
jgi:hypothetical protein